MMQQEESLHAAASAVAPAFPQVHTVTPGAVFTWLRAAALDMQRAPAASLFYGIVFVVMGWLLQFYFADRPHITLGLATGFTLIGPFLCLGLYDISRRLETAPNVKLAATLVAWRTNAPAIAFYAIILMLLLAGWMRVSVVLVALFYDGAVPSAASLVREVLHSTPDLTFLAVYFGVGAAFALLVFAVSVISIPLMVDRGTDTITAMLVSVVALARNFPAMLLWGFSIAVLTFAGLATHYIALAFTVPLIGHGTWHAYRAVVKGS